MIRTLVRKAILLLAHTLGTRIMDARTGEKLGRAFVIPWRGRIHVVGLPCTLQVSFQPQKRLTYWKQEIIFTAHPPPDFPNERPPA